MAKPKPIPLADVVACLAEKLECLQAETERMLGSVQMVVWDLVTEGKAVRLPELATFNAVDISARQVRNRATKGMQIAAATRQVRTATAGPFKTVAKEVTV